MHRAGRQLFFAIAAGAFLFSAANAQTPPLTGDYTGTLGRQHLVLHILRDSAGSLTCSVDLSAEQQYYESGLPCGEVAAAAGHLRFAIPLLQGSYEGLIGADGKTLTGSWTQRGELVAKEPTALVFTREEFVAAEKPSPVDGDWQGVVDGNLGRAQVVIHVKSDRSGKEYVALDVPALSNGFGMLTKNAVLKGNLFSFDIGPDHFGGKLSADGKTIAGVVEQGADFPALTLTRIERASRPSLVDGDWTGMLETKDGPLHAQVRIGSDGSGKEDVDFSSPDQHARHLVGANAVLNGNSFSFEVPSIQGSYAGAVTAAGDAIQGTWTQGRQWPLNLERAPQGSVDEGPIQSDLPRPPLPLAELHAQMDAELRPMVENPAFAGMSGIGIAIGVYKQGERAVFTYGVAKPDSLFEIGSVTGTFTGLILAKMVAEGKVTLETPVRELLPPGMAAKPAGPEITLLSLATFHSGMQHMMDGFHPSDPANPLADFTARKMHDYLTKTGVALQPGIGFDHSDAGIALLGEALADKAGESYSKLLREEVLDPLRLEHTFLKVPAQERENALTGYDFTLHPARAWDFDALAPSDGIWSNVTDMLNYMVAQLQPPAGPLVQAVSLQHGLRSVTDDGADHLFRIGLDWMFEPSPRNYFSLGQVGGFTSFVFFNREQQLAGVVLFNRDAAAENVGYRIENLLEGTRAYPLLQLR